MTTRLNSTEVNETLSLLSHVNMSSGQESERGLIKLASEYRSYTAIRIHNTARRNT